ncbi:hypothetical protein ACI2JA_10855 [Alkalihalobacillus sp. NPDC078783]
MRLIYLIFKANKTISMGFFITCILFFSFVYASVSYINLTNYENNNLETFSDKNKFEVVDNLTEEKERVFLSDPKNLDILYNFAQELYKSEDFNFYNVSNQSHGLRGYTGKNTVYDGYEEGLEPIKYYKENDTEEYVGVKTLRVTSEVLELANIQLQSGRVFNEEEYIYNKDVKKIPILLGDDYSNEYNIGDTLEIEYFTTDYEAEVVGIISADQEILDSYSNPDLSLNRYIILPLPLFNEPPSQLYNEGGIDQTFILSAIFDSVNGLVLSDKNDLNTRLDIERIGNATKFEDFQLIGANSLKLDSLVSISTANVVTVSMTLSLLAVISISLFLVTIYLFIKYNIQTFTSLLIFGYNINKIKRLILKYIVIMVTVCALIVYLIYNSIFKFQTGSYFYLLLIFFLIIIVTPLIELFIRRNLNQSRLIYRMKR